MRVKGANKVDERLFEALQTVAAWQRQQHGLGSVLSGGVHLSRREFDELLSMGDPDAVVYEHLAERYPFKVIARFGPLEAKLMLSVEDFQRRAEGQPGLLAWGQEMVALCGPVPHTYTAKAPTVEAVEA